MASPRWSQTLAVCCALLAAGCALSAVGQNAGEPRLSNERVVMTTDWGEIEIAFYPDIAPITVPHILKLFQLGGYITNHIFRVHAGFVLQVASVSIGRIVPMNALMAEEEAKTVPLETSPEVKHVAGVVSMARHDDPDSGTSSFSLLLGDAPHLDGEFTLFGKVVRGFDVMQEIGKLNYTVDGPFRLPTQRVGIHSTYWYTVDDTCGFKLNEGDDSSSDSNGSNSGNGRGKKNNKKGNNNN